MFCADNRYASCKSLFLLGQHSYLRARNYTLLSGRIPHTPKFLEKCLSIQIFTQILLSHSRQATFLILICVHITVKNITVFYFCYIKWHRLALFLETLQVLETYLVFQEWLRGIHLGDMILKNISVHIKSERSRLHTTLCILGVLKIYSY